MDQHFFNLLVSMKDYIEESECALHRQHDPFWALDEAIAKREMPDIYYEILDEFSALSAHAVSKAA